MSDFDDFTDRFCDEHGKQHPLTPFWRQMCCGHWNMSDVDADGRRICLGCGMVTGPPPDLATDFAHMYLAGLRAMGIEITDYHEAFAADLARSGKPSL